MCRTARFLAPALLVTALAAACSVTIEPAHQAGATSDNSAPATALPTSTSLPVPIETTWANIRDQADGTLVAITGRVSSGWSVLCIDHLCDIDLSDPEDSGDSINLTLLAVATAAVPNTMVELPEHYTEDDLRLTADDGSPITSGAVVRVVGKVGHRDTRLKLTAYQLAIASESSSPTPPPSATPSRSPSVPPPPTTPAVTTPTFAELARLPEGTVVRIKGTLSLPFITSCGATCSIHLDDPRSSRWTYVEIQVLGEGDAQSDGMLELPSNYRNRDLVVFASDGTQLGAGDKVWITGTLDNEPTEDNRRILVITIEPVS